jgi:cyclopropane-fatty-acyl-phospholipid synthase
VARALLRTFTAGSIEIVWPDGRVERFEGPDEGPHARMEVASGQAIRRLMTSGTIGFAEGYMRQEWDTPDLRALLDWGMANVKRNGAASVSPLFKPAQRAWHALNDNTHSGSKRNIEHHYDLGNDFYELWLDESMTYSCALFDRPEGDLCDAQQRKWDRMLELLQPSSADRILEIGCGWGGFAIHAAREAGCKVTGITLSDEQFAHAVSAVEQAGLEGMVDIRMQDYRDVPETYSAIASIEMFEAVGEKWWPAFFTNVRDRLDDAGRAAIQTITICEESFEAFRKRVDFTQRYIFPGGMLPSPARFAEVAHEAGLDVGEPHFMGAHYAHTLDTWLDRFDEVWPQIESLGFDERFRRMWRYYLAYCRTGFLSKNIDVMQVRVEPR